MSARIMTQERKKNRTWNIYWHCGGKLTHQKQSRGSGVMLYRLRSDKKLLIGTEDGTYLLIPSKARVSQGFQLVPADSRWD